MPCHQFSSMILKGDNVELLVELSYRSPLEVCETVYYRKLNVYFALCPRCKVTIEREYQAFCDRCGQCLSWVPYPNGPGLTITLR